MRLCGAWLFAAMVLLLGACAGSPAGPGSGPGGRQVSSMPVDPYSVPEQVQVVGRYVVVLNDGASLNDRHGALRLAGHAADALLLHGLQGFAAS